MKSSDNCITREESALELLERIKRYNINWIGSGHIKGDNTHNVSATVSVKDHEWEQVKQWLWDNKDYYNGITILPYYGGKYHQAPFEEISEEQYIEYINLFSKFQYDFKKVDGIVYKNLEVDLACTSGSCEIM